MNPGLDLCCRHAGHDEPERGVFVDGLPRQQTKVLEHHRDPFGGPLTGLPPTMSSPELS